MIETLIGFTCLLVLGFFLWLIAFIDSKYPDFFKWVLAAIYLGALLCLVLVSCYYLGAEILESW